MSNKRQKQLDIINQRIKELNSIYHTAALRSGISDGEACIWSVLLSSKEEYSQRDLADLLSLPSQTVNSIVSNLGKKGYVTLAHVPGTRNKKTVHLTEAGREYGKREVEWIFDAERKAIAKSDPEQIEIFIELVESYIANLQEAMDGSHDCPNSVSNK